jgi:hypothetical protein
MTASETPVGLQCPSWCRSHEPDVHNRRGGGVTALHESTVLSWVDGDDDEGHIAGIRRIDEYAGDSVEGIYIGHHRDFVWDITADEARRLSRVLVQLADVLDQPATT